MNNKIKALMELNSQVETICKAVAEENALKDKAIIESYKTRWESMWDELEEFITVIDAIKPIGCHRLGKYTFGYPYGYKATGKRGLTFVTNTDFPAVTMLDGNSGWGKITRNSFKSWMNSTDRKSIEFLLDNWTDVKFQIETDLQKRLENYINNKIKNTAETTEDLDKRMELLGIKVGITIAKEIV